MADDVLNDIDAEALEAMIARAIELYGVRITDNIDLSKLASPVSRARIVGNVLMENADLRGYVMGRELLSASGR